MDSFILVFIIYLFLVVLGGWWGVIEGVGVVEMCVYIIYMYM